jgi:hypothetical protein
MKILTLSRHPRRSLGVSGVLVSIDIHPPNSKANLENDCF